MASISAPTSQPHFQTHDPLADDAPRSCQTESRNGQHKLVISPPMPVADQGRRRWRHLPTGRAKQNVRRRTTDAMALRHFLLLFFGSRLSALFRHVGGETCQRWALVRRAGVNVDCSEGRAAAAPTTLYFKPRFQKAPHPSVLRTARVPILVSPLSL
ncbi:hypothetical protein CDD80_3572 [Ophiocordyceps camponoti-rufipedis]|uniref:Uncharacterized protein n=1 Tax=Ophiocordyceps camponoti-rufipedis TaxID=2004952 RepID=A0A2C5YW49_9HYPO|nr:hypothetical protein CDD80_3572 [Ophiocordyceps camponoti-rufipedis]